GSFAASLRGGNGDRADGPDLKSEPFFLPREVCTRHIPGENCLSEILGQHDLAHLVIRGGPGLADQADATTGQDQDYKYSGKDFQPQLGFAHDAVARAVGEAWYREDGGTPWLKMGAAA